MVLEQFLDYSYPFRDEKVVSDFCFICANLTNSSLLLNKYSVGNSDSKGDDWQPSSAEAEKVQTLLVRNFLAFWLKFLSMILFSNFHH